MTTRPSASKEQPPAKPLVPFWCGGVSAMAAACFTHPIDLIKVHLQTSTTRKLALQTTRKIIHEAGILGLYSGLSAALLRQGTYTMARFAVYDLAKDTMRQANGGRSLNGAQVGVATLLSGVAGGIVGNPAEILNVRMQNDQALPEYLRRNYRNAVHGLVAMVREEGARSLTIGLGPSLVRATLATASQFVSYDILKEQLLAAGYPDTVSVHFAASFMAGLVATTVCSPADVIKSRTMAALRHQSPVLTKSGKRVHLKTPSMWRTFTSIYQAEGLRAFFKGWLPSYARLCPQLVITFIIYEKLRKVYFSRYKTTQSRR
ncbi:Mitochondrial dicarboxylate transporter [Coemansia sp. RSA 2559]|nr:Mitochondrial dicarboxylate transporter [Coemansia sp. RSA 2559]KAJ2861011.1 Mitochondrial dicarboxylate transporter [Coemansia erecta]